MRRTWLPGLSHTGESALQISIHLNRYKVQADLFYIFIFYLAFPGRHTLTDTAIVDSCSKNLVKLLPIALSQPPQILILLRYDAIRSMAVAAA